MVTVVDRVTNRRLRHPEKAHRPDTSIQKSRIGFA